MIITSSNIVMQSSHLLQEYTTREERLQFWVGNRGSRPGFPPTRLDPSPALLGDIVDQLDLSSEARCIQALSTEEACDELELTPEEKLKISLIESMLEFLSGKKVKIKIPKLPLKELSQFSQPAQVQNQPAQAGWGLRYDFRETRFEHEQVSFQAAGQVQTADGKTINISIQLNMSRTFYSHQSISIRAGDAVLTDPLVVNFDGPAAALTERNFQFDLDCDGKPDQISFVRPGSGFLALDRNGDGVINDGSELFGPQTGNGFLELAAYDEDGNGWIDEADEIFDCLRIWTRDAQGNEVLFALGEKGIGAIYLGYADTQFSMRDSHNQENGQLRSTGIFLRENGGVGSIQQVDLLA
jgi:hypothetical protein